MPDYQLSLAIGKEGQNARLAAKLTNWKIDIKSESQFEEYLEENNMTEDDLYEKLGYESEEDYEMRKGNEVEENEESNDELSDFQGE